MIGADDNHGSKMKGILQPNENDVLCGRGGATLRHVGNKRYRSLIKTNKPLYLISMKEQKTAISRSIVAAIRNRSGRFLDRGKDKKWFDIGDSKATEKTSQALREGQAKLRQELIGSRSIQNNMKSVQGSFDAMFPQVTKVSVPVKTTFIELVNVSDSSLKYDHTMNSQSFVRSQSSDNFDSINESTFQNHRARNDHFQGSYAPNFIEYDNSKGSSSFSDNKGVVRPYIRSATITPPFSSKRKVESNDQISQSLPILLEDKYMRKKTQITSNHLTENFDDSQSIMTFEMDKDELLFDDDSNSSDNEDMVPQSSSSPPLSPVTNHLRKLTELNNMEPLKLERFRIIDSAFSSLREGNNDQIMYQQQYPQPQQQVEQIQFASSRISDKYRHDGYNARGWSI